MQYGVLSRWSVLMALFQQALLYLLCVSISAGRSTCSRTDKTANGSWEERSRDIWKIPSMTLLYPIGIMSTPCCMYGSNCCSTASNVQRGHASHCCNATSPRQRVQIIPRKGLFPTRPESPPRLILSYLDILRIRRSAKHWPYLSSWGHGK
jgi:hypothetical protein